MPWFRLPWLADVKFYKSTDYNHSLYNTRISKIATKPGNIHTIKFVVLIFSVSALHYTFIFSIRLCISNVASSISRDVLSHRSLKNKLSNGALMYNRQASFTPGPILCIIFNLCSMPPSFVQFMPLPSMDAIVLWLRYCFVLRMHMVWIQTKNISPSYFEIMKWNY